MGMNNDGMEGCFQYPPQLLWGALGVGDPNKRKYRKDFPVTAEENSGIKLIQPSAPVAFSRTLKTKFMFPFV
jgi:hypothetical protein